MIKDLRLFIEVLRQGVGRAATVDCGIEQRRREDAKLLDRMDRIADCGMAERQCYGADGRPKHRTSAVAPAVAKAMVGRESYGGQVERRTSNAGDRRFTFFGYREGNQETGLEIGVLLGNLKKWRKRARRRGEERKGRAN